MLTCSGTKQTCAAGGGVAKGYRPRFPFDPYDVICCCCKSVISNYLPVSVAYYAFVGDPVLSVPHLHVSCYRFYRHKPSVCQNGLPFCDAGEFCHLTFLAQVPVLSVLDNGHLKHLAGRHAIDIPAVIEYVLPPFLSCKEGKDTCLNGGEVCHKDLVPLLRYDGGANQLAQGLCDAAVQGLHGSVVAVADKLPAVGKVGHLVLGHILKLYQPPGESPRSVSPVELEAPAHVVIPADGAEHGGVLGGGRLGQFGTNRHKFLGLIRL